MHSASRFNPISKESFARDDNDADYAHSEDRSCCLNAFCCGVYFFETIISFALFALSIFCIQVTCLSEVPHIVWAVLGGLVLPMNLVNYIIMHTGYFPTVRKCLPCSLEAFRVLYIVALLGSMGFGFWLFQHQHPKISDLSEAELTTCEQSLSAFKVILDDKNDYSTFPKDVRDLLSFLNVAMQASFGAAFIIFILQCTNLARHWSKRCTRSKKRPVYAVGWQPYSYAEESVALQDSQEEDFREMRIKTTILCDDAAPRDVVLLMNRNATVLELEHKVHVFFIVVDVFAVLLCCVV